MNLYIYENKLDIVWFQHDMAYENFENWSRKAASDNLLHDEKFNIDKNPNNVGYQQGFATMIYKCFNKKVSGGDAK